MKRKAVLVALAVLCVIAQVAGGLFAVGNENRWIGFLGMVLGLPVFAFLISALYRKPWVFFVAFFLGGGIMVVSLATARPLWLSAFGETSECVVLAEREVEVSKYGSETWYSLRCGDQRHDDVVLSSLRGPVGDVGDRTTVVFDRLGLQSPARPDEVGTAKAWLLPPALLAALGFVAFAATRRLEPEPHRGSAG